MDLEMTSDFLNSMIVDMNSLSFLVSWGFWTPRRATFWLFMLIKCVITLSLIHNFDSRVLMLFMQNCFTVSFPFLLLNPDISDNSSLFRTDFGGASDPNIEPTANVLRLFKEEEDSTCLKDPKATSPWTLFTLIESSSLPLRFKLANEEIEGASELLELNFGALT